MLNQLVQKIRGLIVVILILGAACSGDNTKPTGNNPIDNSFRVRMTVTDGTGTPVPGLRVSCWNNLDIPLRAGGMYAKSDTEAIEPAAATMIEFQLTEDCSYELTILNIESDMVDQFSGVANAGRTSFVWTPGNLRSGLYCYNLIAHSVDDGELLINDINCAYLHLLDPGTDSIGNSDSD